MTCYNHEQYLPCLVELLSCWSHPGRGCARVLGAAKCTRVRPWGWSSGIPLAHAGTTGLNALHQEVQVRHRACLNLRPEHDTVVVDLEGSGRHKSVVQVVALQ